MTEITECPICGTEYYDRTGSQKTCPGKTCRKAQADASKKTKHWSGAKDRIQRIQKADAKEQKATWTIKAAIIADMVRDTGYAHCEICGIWGLGHALELHHIAYRSEVPNHPKKHSRINTVLLCRDCHAWIHSAKSNRDGLVVARRLWEVFPEKFKREFYEKRVDDSQ